jgi:hypothetical protein
MTAKRILSHKQARLDRARSALKASFIGIDTVIDRIIDAIGSWYLFPHLHDRPVVVNLWGLTGVGKTSLVMRLAKELDMMEVFRYFDMGEAGENSDHVRTVLMDILEHGNGKPNLLVLDEFQHARTIEENSHERRHPENRTVWQLLDSGTLLVRPHFWDYRELIDHLPKLRQLVHTGGIRVERGWVVEGVDHFMKSMNMGVRPFCGAGDGAMVPLIHEALKEDLMGILSDRFGSTIELTEFLETLDGPESIRYLEKALLESQRPRLVDCSRSLIFVLGNLDEAYPMTKSLNPDLDADEFHERSKRISLTDVKTALQKRFRSEQISRLGNTHIIYPAFSRNTYERIVANGLDEIAATMWTQERLRLRFDASVHDIVYREGVFPTQGARPVLSTLCDMVRSKMSVIAVEAKMKGLGRHAVRMGYASGTMVVDFLDRAGTVAHRLVLPQPAALEELRKPTRDDRQAIAAVHEAGHAVAAIVLRRILPEQVMSVSVEDGIGGYVLLRDPLSYTAKSHLLNELACYLAGHAAERMVFGEEHLTLGAEDDIERATGLITHAIKACGIGDVCGAYHHPAEMTRGFLTDTGHRLSQQAEQWLSQAMVLAEETLLRQKRLFLVVAEHLSEHRQLDQEDLRKMVAAHAVDFDLGQLLRDGDDVYYRSKLKSEIDAYFGERRLRAV